MSRGSRIFLWRPHMSFDSCVTPSIKWLHLKSDLLENWINPNIETNVTWNIEKCAKWRTCLMSFSIYRVTLYFLCQLSIPKVQFLSPTTFIDSFLILRYLSTPWIIQINFFGWLSATFYHSSSFTLSFFLKSYLSSCFLVSRLCLSTGNSRYHKKWSSLKNPWISSVTPFCFADPRLIPPIVKHLMDDSVLSSIYSLSNAGISSCSFFSLENFGMNKKIITIHTYMGILLQIFDNLA